MISFNDLGLETKIETTEISLGGDHVASVRNYLPINEKGEFIQYVASSALDMATGTFSPLRVEVYFALAICKWYAGIEIDDTADVAFVYDALNTNGIIEKIAGAIDKSEWDYISELTEETIQDMARYNASAAGIIANMSNSASTLDTQITDILEKIKNREGMELLGEIRDITGNSISEDKTN